jgi:hypothetical protein
MIKASTSFSVITLVIVLSFWIIVLLMIDFLSIPQSYGIINPITQILILTGCGGLAMVMVARNTLRLWYPITWFLLTAGIYYGFGPLLYYFGNTETIIYVDAFYSVDDYTLWRVNLLTLIGIISVLTIYYLLKKTAIRFNKEPIGGIIQIASSKSLEMFSIIFILIGMPIKLLFVMPKLLGFSNVVLPGSFESIGTLSLISLLPLYELYRRKNSLLTNLIFFSVLLLEIGSATMLLSKLEILKIIIIFSLSLTLRGVSFKRIVVLGISVILLYNFFLSPLINYGRIAFNKREISQSKGLIELFNDFSHGKANKELSDIFPGVQTSWGRLNYASAQAFAMDAYDQGQNGETFMLIIWTLVPRFIYPDKPIMTTGDYFNELVTGNPNSFSAPGMFAEGYWNTGWIGLLIVSIVLGFLYTFVELYTKTHLIAGNFHFIPVMFFGIFPAIQQDSWFVPSTFGFITIAIAFHWIMFLFFQRKKFKIR